MEDKNKYIKYEVIQDPEVVDTVTPAEELPKKVTFNNLCTFCKEILVPLKDVLVPIASIVAGWYITHDAMEHGYSANIKFGNFAEVSITDKNNTDITSAAS